MGVQIPEPEEENLDGYSGKSMVRIIPTLHKKLAEGAKKNGVSMNHYTSELLSERCSTIENYERPYSQLGKAITSSKPSPGEYLTAGEKHVPYTDQLQGMEKSDRDTYKADRFMREQTGSP